MSWALEEWKEGLPTRALQKIQELEGQLDKLKKEKQQRQFQLDSLEAALQKQKQKVEDGKTEGADLKRENQRLMEICENLEKAKQKVSHELQVKESKVNFQEGQLSSCKKQIEKLEQELKRCKSELERSHQAIQSMDVSLNPCSTPQKLFTTPLTPSQCYIGSTYEDLKEKYNKEVEERKKLEAEIKALHAKNVSQPVPQATMNHRDIARHQASSSVFSWQQEKTPSHLSSSSLKTPLRRDVSASHFWGEEVTPNRSSLQTGKRDCSSSFCDDPSSSQLLEQVKAQNQDLKSKMNELELRLQGQEKEMKGQVNKFQELQLLLEKTKMELTEKEKVLNKTRDELVRTSAQCDQAAAKCITLEQKLKNLTEELSCQRQNAESARCSLEQKIKEKEKELQEELSRQHRSFQALDQEYTQMKTRLTQELQQAKHALNVLQVEQEKVVSVKQQLERSLEEFRQKLNKTEQALQESQITENELRRSTEEMKKENSLIRNQSEQRAREVCHLEDELGKVKVCLSQSQNFAEDMREASLRTQQIQSHDYSERVRTLEMERENLNVEIRNLHSMIDSKMVEIETQKQAYLELQQKAEFSDQKHQKEIENMCLKANELTGQVEDLEYKLQLLSSEVVTKEQQYQGLRTEYETLRDLLKSRGSLVTNEDNQRSSLAFEQQPTVSDSFGNLMGEQGSMYSERSDCFVDGDQTSENLSVLQNRVTSLESSLESQNQMNSDLQKQCEELLQIKEEIEENLIKAEQIHQNFVDETNQRIGKLQEDSAVHQNIVAETLATLESKEKELQLLKEKLEADQTEIQELKKSNCLLEETLKELQLSSETLSSEKKEMSDIISLNKKDIEELTQENGALKEVNEALWQEKMNLLQKHEEISRCVAEQERSISELSDQYKQERHLLLQRCEETETVLEDLRGNYKTAQENNARLECLLSECTAACENRKNELEQLKEAFAKEQQEFLTKLAFSEEQNRKLMLKLEIEQQTVKSKITDTKIYSKIESVENSVKATEDEINMCSSQCQMDIDTKDISPDSYKAQLVQLEALIKVMEVKLDQSEEEKKTLHQELQTIRGELETVSSQDTQSHERIGLKDCEIEAEGKYVSVLHELSTSQNENAHLQCSLQTALNELTELGKVCEVLKVEKLKLQSELNDSRSQCITATSKMAAEVEKLVNEVKILNHEGVLPQSKLMKDVSDVLHDKRNMTPLDSSGFCEQITLSDKEVPVHFAELQEKFSCLQNEHKILHDQHCEVSSKMSELCSYVDTLQAENSVLSVNLRNLKGDLVKERKPGAENGHTLSVSFCGTDSPSLTNFGEALYKDVLEQTDNTSLLSLEGNASANPCNVDDVSYSSLEEENLTEKEIPAASVRTIEELEILCQVYLQSLKNLEEKIESQGIMKNKEIQELEQLLSSERNELGCLREQYLSEKEQWQQKLTSVTLEMESKLAEAKQQTKNLSLELEVARLQLQELDLSSRSLLGTDMENAVQGQNDSYDIKESEVSVSETTEKTSTQDTDQTCDKDVQQDLCLETLITKTETARFTGEGCEEQSLQTNCEASAEDKTQDYSECISELFSSPNVLIPMDILEDQGSSQNLHLQKDTSNENLRLPPVVDDWDKKVESLLNEIKESGSKLSLQEVQLKIKIETCMQLEKIVKDLKKEKSDLSEKLESLPCNQEVHQRIESREDLVFDVELGTSKLSGAIKDSAANIEDNWKEKFLDVEKELIRIQSEKANLEHLILSVEADLKVVQAEKLHLERDTESKQKVIVDLKEELFVVISERNRLCGELDTVSEERKALDQMSKKMKEKVEELESHQSESLRHIEVVEAEVKDKAELPQTLSFNVSELTKDKAHLQEQLQSLQNDSQGLSLAVGELEIQIGQLSKEKESLVKESQNFQVKLTETECEKQNISKALEVALMEKDEKKHFSTEEKLKESQRENDSLKDKVENLERELEMSEEHQELVILDAENSKAEVETLKAQMDEMAKNLSVFELDLVTVRSERENLTRQLQDKQSRVSELDELCSSFRSLLEEKEKARVQMEEDSNSAVLMLQTQLQEFSEQIAALCNDQETSKTQEQSLDQAGEEVHPLKSSIQKLKARIHAGEKEQHCLLGQLRESKHYADVLKDRVENLEQELKLSEANREHVTLKAESSKAEIQTLKSEIQGMVQNIQDLELELTNTRSENENLMKGLKQEQKRVSELETKNSSIENLLKEKEQEKVQMEEESKITMERLQTQLRELNETMISLCNDQEAYKTKEQNLSGQVQTLEVEKAQLLQDFGETKNKYISLQSSVNVLTQEIKDGKQKLEKKEEEVRTLEDQLKGQEQLVCKLSQLEGEQQLWQKQKVELGNLTVELEQKIQVLQSKNSALQHTFEALQNSYKSLESELGLMKTEKVSLVQRINTMIGKEAQLQRELHLMVQKTTRLKEEFNKEKNRLTEELKVPVEELKNLKVEHCKSVNQLEKEFQRAQGKIKLLLKSCKQLEREKGMLEKEICQLEAAQKQKAGTVVGDNVAKLMTENKELKETLEEKIKEADKYLDKYCSLLISHEELEKAKEMLELQVARLSSQQSKQRLHSSPLLNSSVPGPSPATSVSEKSTSGQSKTSGKRQRSSGIWENGSGTPPCAPETFSKKSKKTVNSSVHPTEDKEETKFELEGLPEVVKKGFADIPTGKTSPYILRRTTMPIRTSPRLAAQKLVGSSPTPGKENIAESSKPTAGGSRSQKVKVVQQSSVDSCTAIPESLEKSLTACNVPGRNSAESPTEDLSIKQGYPASSPAAGPNPPINENCRVQ
ncbi:centromere protein F [Cricetulus griseus]